MGGGKGERRGGEPEIIKGLIFYQLKTLAICNLNKRMSIGPGVILLKPCVLNKVKMRGTMNKFCTVISKVSSFAGNHIRKTKSFYLLKIKRIINRYKLLFRNSNILGKWYRQGIFKNVI